MSGFPQANRHKRILIENSEFSKLELLCFEEHEASFYYLGVIERAFVFPYLIEGWVNAQSWPVRTGRGHCLYHVGHCKNPCFEQYILAFETLGIAGTIHPLMMLKYNLCHRIRQAGFFEDVIS